MQLKLVKNNIGRRRGLKLVDASTSQKAWKRAKDVYTISRALGYDTPFEAHFKECLEFENTLPDKPLYAAKGKSQILR